VWRINPISFGQQPDALLVGVYALRRLAQNPRLLSVKLGLHLALFLRSPLDARILFALRHHHFIFRG
jgi:hypothetical protein